MASSSSSGTTDAPATTTSRRSFASKNLNALTKAPAVQRGADRAGDVVRPAYGAGGRLLVLGSKNRDATAAGNLATPVPVNTPSLRRENNGQDISVPLVPSGGVGWGANKQPAPAPALPKEEPPPVPPARPELYVPPNKSAFARERAGGGGRPDARGYPPPRAPSGRPPQGQDGRAQPGRDGPPLSEEAGYRRLGLGSGGGHGGRGHHLSDSDFPLEMGGSTKPEKTAQLRSRGTEQPDDKVDTTRGQQASKSEPASSSSPTYSSTAPAGPPPGPNSGPGSPPGPMHDTVPGRDPRDRERPHPSPLAGGKPGPQDGQDAYGPPPITARMGGGRGPMWPRAGPDRGRFGGGMSNGSMRGDGPGGPGYGHHYGGDFRGNGGGRGSGGWDGGRGRDWDGSRGRDWDRDRGGPGRDRELDWEQRRRWVPPGEREGTDRGHDKDNGRNWDRARGREGGHSGSGGIPFSPRTASISAQSSATRTSNLRRPPNGQDGDRSSPTTSPLVAPTAAPTARPPSPRGVSDEDRKLAAEGVAEEARAFAERERRLAEKSDEVEKGVALRARMELARLRAEKEGKEQQMEVDEERRRRAEMTSGAARSSSADEHQRASGTTASTNASTQHQHESDEPEGAGGRGYEPDGYGRDDPYRRQEDVERERAAQQAAAAALSPATSGSWGPSSSIQKPKPLPKVKALLGRGQQEVVEAGTGARVIQPREIPPASPATMAKEGPTHNLQAGKRQTEQPAAARNSPRESKSEDVDGKSRSEPTQLFLAERPEKPQQVAPTSAGKSRGEPSSLSLQWLTPRREGADAAGLSPSGASSAEHRKQEAPSAWAQRTNESRQMQGRGASGANGPSSFDRPPGAGAHDCTAAGAMSNVSFRNPRIIAEECAQAPPSPFSKETGRTFSSLFIAPGQERGKGDFHDQASGDSRGPGFPPGDHGTELGRDWPEAGRGSLPREHKRIFDYKTGKMRDVEDSDKMRGVSDRPPRSNPQDARVDGRPAPTLDTRHHHTASRSLLVDHNSNHTPSQPDAESLESAGKRGEVNDGPTAEAQQYDRREQPRDGRRPPHSRETDSGGRGGGRGGGQGWDDRREWGRSRGGGGGGRWEERGGDGRDRGWGGRGRGSSGRGDSAGRDINKTWERGVRPVIATRPASQREGLRNGGRGNGRNDAKGGQAPSSRRRVSPLDEEHAVSPGASSAASSPASAASPRLSSTGIDDHGPAVAGASAAGAPPSPALRKEAGRPGEPQSQAGKKFEPIAQKQATWGRRALPPPSPSSRQDARQQGHPKVMIPASARPSSASNSPSTGSTGGDFVVEEDREAIRARDERERDLAVQQRRMLDLASSKEADRQQKLMQQQQQQLQKRQRGHGGIPGKPETDKERGNTRREQRERDAEHHRVEDFKARREARQKESRERAPRTSGALYRRNADVSAGDPEYVNADIPEGWADPLQERWDAITEELGREQEHEHERNSRVARVPGNHANAGSVNNHSKKDAVLPRKASLHGYGKDGTVRESKDYAKSGAKRSTEPTAGGPSGGSGSWGSGREKDTKGKRPKRQSRVELTKEEAERLAKEQEIEREAKAKEEREKLKEARKERKKLKRGGGEDASAVYGGDFWSQPSSTIGVNPNFDGDVSGQTLIPGRVVVDNDDQLGINTGQFDTAEFEVVKSRKELQKERKEQRDQEEREAAEQALQRAQAEAAAARKAAQQLARETLKAKRELNRAEARKVEAQRRADAQAKAKAVKDAKAGKDTKAAKTCPTARAAADASASVAPESQVAASQSTTRQGARTASTGEQAVKTNTFQSTSSSNTASRNVEVSPITLSVEGTEVITGAADEEPSGLSTERSLSSSMPSSSEKPASLMIQFGDVGVEAETSAKQATAERSCSRETQGMLPNSKRDTTAAAALTDTQNKHERKISSPREPAPAAGSSSAGTFIPSANAQSNTSPNDATAFRGKDETAAPQVGGDDVARAIPMSSHEPPMASGLDVSPRTKGSDYSGTERPDRNGTDDESNAGKVSGPPPSSGDNEHKQRTRPLMARGLLSSPSLAGSIPAPPVSAAWKPLPVGMATTFGMVGNLGIANAGAAAAAAAATVVTAGGGGNPARNGSAEAWRGSPQTTTSREDPATEKEANRQHQIEKMAQPLSASQAGWIPGRGNRGTFGPGSIPSGQSQRANVGPASAPAAPGAAGWNPSQGLVQRHAGGMAGMPGANGGGSSVGARLRSAPEAFAVGVSGGSPGVQSAAPVVMYGALASGPNAKVMARSTSGGHDGSPAGSHSRIGGQSAQTGGMAAHAAGGARVGTTGNAFSGFMSGYRSSGANQPVMPGGGNWTGASLNQKAGSPMANVVGGPGGVKPSGVQQQLQQQQHQQSPQLQARQQQPLYNTFVPGVSSPAVSSAQHVMMSQLSPSPDPTPVAASPGVAATPTGDSNTVLSSGLAAEAPPFIPAGALNTGGSPMWGVAGPPLPAGMVNPTGLNGQPSLPNTIMLNPTVSHGRQFGVGGGIAMGVGMRPGQIAGAVAVPSQGMAPTTVSVNVRGGIITRAPQPPPPPPATFATQQMQQQMHLQQQMHQQQLAQLQQQHRRWLASSATGILPIAHAPHPQVMGQTSSGSKVTHGGSPTRWAGSQMSGQNGGVRSMTSPRANVNKGDRDVDRESRLETEDTSEGAGGSGPHAQAGEQTAQQGCDQQDGGNSVASGEKQAENILGPANGGTARVKTDESGRHPLSPSQGGKKPASRKTDSQALYVPKRSTRGTGAPGGGAVAPPPAVPAAGS